MTDNNKRPRLVTAAKGVNSLEMETTNSTLNLALGGGHQKSWMTGQGAGQSVVQAHNVKNSFKPPQHGSRRQPPSLNTSRRNSLPVTSNKRRGPSTSVTTPSSAQVNRPNWPIQDSAQTTHEASSVNIIDLVASPECSPNPNEGLQQGAILPSPAPSDEVSPQGIDQTATNDVPPQQQDSTATASTGISDLNRIQRGPERPATGCTDSSSNPGAPSTSGPEIPHPDSERLRQLAAWYGGVEELEKQLRLVDRTPDNPPLNPSNTQSQSVIQLEGSLRSTTQGTSDTQLQAAAELTHFTAAPPDQRPPPVTQPLAEGNTDPSSSFQTPQMASSASSLYLNRIIPTNPFKPTVPNEAEFQSLLIAVNARRIIVSRDSTLSSSQKNIEESRLMLLVEACSAKDMSFLLVHQYYCLCSLPNSSPEWTYSDGIREGLSVISGLLLSNATLKMQSTAWFATFPMRLVNITTQTISNTFGSIYGCLNALAERWHTFNDSHRQSGLPPTICDLQLLGITSTVLQRVVFKSVYRSFWPLPEDSCFGECTRVFETSQKEFPNLFVAWRGAIPTHVLHEWNRRLMQEYRRLSMHHGQHSQTLVNSNVSTSDDSRMNGTGMQVNAGTVADNSRALRIPTTQPPATVLSSRNTPPPPPPPQARQSPINMDFFSFRGPAPQSRQMSLYHRHSLNQNGNHATSPPGYNNPVSLPRQQSHSSPSTPQAPAVQLPTSQITMSRVANPSSLQSVANSQTHQIRRDSTTVDPSDYSVLSQIYSDWVPNQHIQAPQRLSMGPLSETSEAIYSARIMDNILAQNRLPGSDRTRVANTLLFPDPRLQQARPHAQYQSGIPIHQAHPYDATSFGPPQPASVRPKLLSFFKEYLIQPVLIKPITQTVRATFQVDAELRSKLPVLQYDKQIGPTPKRDLKLDSLLIRIRCVRAAETLISEEVWAVSDTEWPPSLVIFLNRRHFEVRRKAGWGKDLAVDLTGYVSDGENKIEASFMRSPQDTNNKHNYALAVEILAVTTGTDLVSHVKELDASDTKQRIRRQLSNNDDEVQVISSDLVIKITDPFSAQLIKQPVRGKSCVHYECFDLEIFLATRKNGVNLPEQSFRCPLCGSDARPTSLQVDNWFVEILAKIREMKEEDAKAIVVDRNADWKIKEEEREGEAGDGGGPRKKSEPMTPGLATEPIVIDLDD